MTAPPEWPAHIKVGTKGFVCSGCFRYSGLSPEDAVAQARLHLISRHGYVDREDLVAAVTGCGLDPGAAAAVVDRLQQQFRILRRSR
ncbi:hypothetical protein Q7689_01070 [Nocardiopsis tropica]|uniref:hypothetical protein n=1 Tax=Nocardiopsis tropica TaxID=109330 RepID=UPI002E86741D|nr:hypothetical protein [Nocardiopsis tropica]